MTGFVRYMVDNPAIPIVATVAAMAFGWNALSEMPVDAIPDISENQSIVFTEWSGRSPQDVENQITLPLSSSLQGIPGVKEVRGLSGFGFSQIYVVFEDDIEFYWARTRVLERLQTARSGLPKGVEPQLGPDATALGQVFWYTLDGPGYDRATLRSLQDWVVRYALQAVSGVSEVASIGGFVRTYQVDINPDKLKFYGIGVDQVHRAIMRANIDVGAKTLERSGMEFVLRGLGFVKKVEDVENIVVAARKGVPIFVRHVADVSLGSDFRRGALADEHGERVGGVVTMRFGENPRAVIARVKKAIETLQSALPEGVTIVPFYDRTQLVEETMGTLKTALIEEIAITLVVILLFLLNVRASLIVAVTLPIAVLMAFIAMRLMGIGSNIMSLAGIAIAIGTMVDMGIVMSENIFSRLQAARDSGDEQPRSAVVASAAGEVAPAIMTAVATTVVSFLPVFMLTGQANRLFTPLAWTKTFALIAALIVAIVLVPVLCHLLLKERTATTGLRARLPLLAIPVMMAAGGWLGAKLPEVGVVPAKLLPIWPAILGALALGWATWRITVERMVPIEKNPVSRSIRWVYEPTLRWILGHKATFAILPLVIIMLGMTYFVGARGLLWPLKGVARLMGGDLSYVRPFRSLEKALPPIGGAFMPPLDEGSFLAMPSLLHQASLSQTMEVMVRMNQRMREVPEVAQVMGKLGRAKTALDPAPVGMMETVVNLKPKSQWRPGITKDDILAELRAKTRTIGVSPSWLQPIETRVVMLQSGIKASMALEIIGAPLKPDGTPYADLEAHKQIEQLAVALEPVVREVRGAKDVNALRLGGKPYIELVVDRLRAGRYDMNPGDVLEAVEVAIGGRNLTWSLEGRERYPIRAQYARELRDDPDKLRRILVPTKAGVKIPLGNLVTIREVIGPASIRTRDGNLTGYLMFNAKDRDEAGVMEDALNAVKAWRAAERDRMGHDPVPKGLRIEPAGRYLNKIEADERLGMLVPIVILINLFLLYVAYRDFGLTLAIFAAIPLTFAGGFIGLWVYPLITGGPPIYLTTAVWIGFIALFGIAVDDGAVMATYLQQSFARRDPKTRTEIREAVVDAGLRRIRPCLMTTFTTILALIPILWTTGRGSDVMQPMALPLVGGMVAELVSLFVLPTIYCWLRERRAGV